MSGVTDADRERAKALRLALSQVAAWPVRDAMIADALAEEREKARAPFLALAEELDTEAQARWVRVLQARAAEERDASFGERGAGDALHDAAVRIRRTAEADA